MKILKILLLLLTFPSLCYAGSHSVQVVISTASGAADITLGETTTTDAYGTPWTSNGEIRLYRRQATATGSVSAMNFYHYSPTNWIGLIYSDSAGEPNTLLASTASTAGVGYSWAWSGLTNLDAAESITSGAWYWIGVQTAGITDSFYYSKQNLVTKSYVATFGSPPATWPTGSDTDLDDSTGAMVIYAD